MMLSWLFMLVVIPIMLIAPLVLITLCWLGNVHLPPTLSRIVRGYVVVDCSILLALFSGWLFVKLAADHVVLPDVVWSDSKRCYITYNFFGVEKFGGAGRLFTFLDSDFYIQVHRADGTLLKSSRWLLWQHESELGGYAQWSGSQALYPTTDGYSGWVLPECGYMERRTPKPRS